MCIAEIVKLVVLELVVPKLVVLELVVPKPRILNHFATERGRLRRADPRPLNRFE